MATRVAIMGATGYTALELIKILLRHPHVEIVAVTSRQETAPISSIHPSLTGKLDLPLQNLSPAEISARAECVFGCLPHGASAEVIPELLRGGARVVDFSADYRLASADVYQEWYGHKHPDPERLGVVPYGLPELFRDRIRDAELVANPGCYPTSVILALSPLLKAGLISAEDIVVDSKSGVSGAGRSPKLTTHFPECNESVSAYGVGRHRHVPEIDRILSEFGGRTTSIIFTPHLIPMDRGILSTTYSRPQGDVSEEAVLDCLREFYKDEPFVQVVDRLPGTKDTLGTNACHITARIVRGRVVTISCIDNLIKGAAGAAVQNFNLMFGYSETTAL
ncbi:N-acetyl-gamma-glutamyl-phosphate reductase [Thermopirellula anaerolimosa]